MDGDGRINPYLAGNFAPIRSEDDFDLPVTGEIPAGLRGALFRIGPNPQYEPRNPEQHTVGEWSARANRKSIDEVVRWLP